MKNLLVSSCMIFIISAMTAQTVHALCVKAPKANLRTGPGTNYDIAWEVFRYMPFQKVGGSLSGDWYAVKDVDGDVNWIHRKLLTEKYRCVVVKTEEVNVRKGPGTHYSKSPLGPVKKYYSFRLLKKQGPWFRVQDERGGIGWIHRKFLWTQ